MIIDNDAARSMYEASVENTRRTEAQVERLTRERDTARATVDFFIAGALMDGYSPGWHSRGTWQAMLEIQAAHLAGKSTHPTEDGRGGNNG